MRRSLALAILATTSTVSAQRDAPLRAIEDLDPLALARAVERTGDAAVLAELDSETPSAAAIHATPYLDAPEAALPRLVALGAGRDPFRAPLAMQAVLRIADGPILDAMTRREADPLDDVRAALAALAADESARADLRGAAALAREQLSFPE